MTTTRPLMRRWTMVGTAAIHSRETSDASTDLDRPVVLLHGVGTTTRYFQPLMHELDGRVPVAAPELPGIGASAPDPVPEDVAGQADLVAGWMRSTARRRALVVGNSMGCQTAVELAVRHPDLVASLVLIGPTVDRAAREPLTQIWKLLVDATVERPSLVGLTLTDSLVTRRRAVVRYFRASLHHHLEERIGAVRAPILLVRGERDPIAPRRWINELAEASWTARVMEIGGGAHACHYGRPQPVADVIETERGRLGTHAGPTS